MIRSPVAGFPLRRGLRARETHHAMAEDRDRQPLDVVRDDVIAAFDQASACDAR